MNSERETVNFKRIVCFSHPAHHVHAAGSHVASLLVQPDAADVQSVSGGCVVTCGAAAALYST